MLGQSCQNFLKGRKLHFHAPICSLDRSIFLSIHLYIYTYIHIFVYLHSSIYHTRYIMHLSVSIIFTFQVLNSSAATSGLAIDQETKPVRSFASTASGTDFKLIRDRIFQDRERERENVTRSSHPGQVFPGHICSGKKLSRFP